jgi:hypothetical protein
MRVSLDRREAEVAAKEAAVEKRIAAGNDRDQSKPSAPWLAQEADLRSREDALAKREAALNAPLAHIKELA